MPISSVIGQKYQPLQHVINFSGITPKIFIKSAQSEPYLTAYTL